MYQSSIPEKYIKYSGILSNGYSSEELLSLSSLLSSEGT